MYALIAGLVIMCILGLLSKRFIIALFSGIWIVTLLFVGVDQYNALKQETVLAIITMLASTYTGLVLSKYRFVFGRSSNTGSNKQEKERQDVTIIRESVLRTVFFLCLVIFCFYFFITIRNAGSLNLAIIRSINSSSSDNSAFKGNIDTLLYYVIAQPLFTVSSIAVVYCYFTKQKLKRSTVILFLSGFLIYLFTNGGRAFVVCVGCFVLAGVFRLLMVRNEDRLDIKKVIPAVIMIVVVLSIMTDSRTGSSITFFRQVREYIGCSLLHMDEEISNIGFHRNNSVNFGYFTYGGFLYYPLKIINILFGTNIKAPSEFFNYLQTFKTINFAGRNVYYNALVPNAFYYYFDSGLLGVCIFSFVAGFIQGQSEKKIKLNNSFINFAFYAIAIYCVLFSPMGSQAWKIFIPLSIVWCLIINRIIGEKI